MRVFQQAGHLSSWGLFGELTVLKWGCCTTPLGNEALLEDGKPRAYQQSHIGSQGCSKLQSLPPEGSSAHRHNGTAPFKRGEN